MKTVKDYHDLHLKCEILLLADVFEKFRNNSLKKYGLCPSHYLNTPALSWDAMLNMRKVELKLIPDLMTQNKNREIYTEKSNNLYGFSMSTFLPTSEFKWIDPKNFDLSKCTSNSSKGCVLKVDLEYSKELRELRNNYLEIQIK